MQTKTYTYLDRSEWPKGQWDNEPDKMQWQDAETGLPCLIVRNSMGALCGYVGVTEGHPEFGVCYTETEIDGNVHGGLTFSDFCQHDANEHGICRLLEPGEPDRVWWFGFDCAHSWDTIPEFDVRFSYGGTSYRTVEYVQAECAKLAKELFEKGVENVHR